jgi:hypothetical protein
MLARVQIVGKKFQDGHQHPRSAVATLQGMLFMERLLHRVELLSLC